jgi:hypothetical protein
MNSLASSESDSRCPARAPAPSIARALSAWRQESTYTGPDDWVWASPHRNGKQPLWLSTIMRYYIQPAVQGAGIQKKVGWHTFRHTFSSLVKSLGVDVKAVQELVRHASFGTTMNGYTQAFESAKRQAQEQLAALIMRIRSDARKSLNLWRPRRDLNIACQQRRYAIGRDLSSHWRLDVRPSRIESRE